MASSEKPMPQIIALGAPPPNPQVIAGDSTEIVEDSAPAELTPHVLARQRRHTVWAFHVHEGVARAAPQRPPVGRLGGVTTVDLLGGAVPWVLRV
jgi:hypothetical protein